MPTAITVDTITKRLFYVETKMRRIETITYEGRGRKMLISNGLIHPLGLALFEDRLYYTDFSLNTIFVANKRTGNSVGILKDSLRRPTGLSIVHPLLQKQGNSLYKIVYLYFTYSVHASLFDDANLLLVLINTMHCAISSTFLSTMCIRYYIFSL